jgi:hypothetical protein
LRSQFGFCRGVSRSYWQFGVCSVGGHRICGAWSVDDHLRRLGYIPRRGWHANGNLLIADCFPIDVLGVDMGIPPVVEDHESPGEMGWLDCDCLLFCLGNILSAIRRIHHLSLARKMEPCVTVVKSLFARMSREGFLTGLT